MSQSLSTRIVVHLAAPRLPHPPPSTLITTRHSLHSNSQWAALPIETLATAPTLTTARRTFHHHYKRRYTSATSASPAQTTTRTRRPFFSSPLQATQPSRAPTTTATRTPPTSSTSSSTQSPKPSPPKPIVPRTSIFETIKGIVISNLEQMDLSIAKRLGFKSKHSTRPISKLVQLNQNAIRTSIKYNKSVYEKWLEDSQDYKKQRLLIPFSHHTNPNPDPISITMSQRHAMAYSWYEARQSMKFQKKASAMVLPQLKRFFIQPSTYGFSFFRAFNDLLTTGTTTSHLANVGWLFGHEGPVSGKMAAAVVAQGFTSLGQVSLGFAHQFRLFLTRGLPAGIAIYLTWYGLMADEGARWSEVKAKLMEWNLWFHHQLHLRSLNRHLSGPLASPVNSLYFHSDSSSKVELLDGKVVAKAELGEIVLWEEIALAKMYDRICDLEALVRTLENTLNASQALITRRHRRRQLDIMKLKLEMMEKAEGMRNEVKARRNQEGFFETILGSSFLNIDFHTPLTFSSFFDRIHQAPGGSESAKSSNPTQFGGPLAVDASMRFRPSSHDDAFTTFLHSTLTAMTQAGDFLTQQFAEANEIVGPVVGAVLGPWRESIGLSPNTAQTQNETQNEIQNYQNDPQTAPNGQSGQNLPSQTSQQASIIKPQPKVKSKEEVLMEEVNDDLVLQNYDYFLETTLLTSFELTRLKSTLRIYRAMLNQLNDRFRPLKDLVGTRGEELLAKTRVAVDPRITQTLTTTLQSTPKPNSTTAIGNLTKLIEAGTVDQEDLVGGVQSLKESEQLEIEFFRFSATTQFVVTAQVLRRLDTLVDFLTHRHSRIENYYEKDHIESILVSIHEKTVDSVKNDVLTQRSLKAMGLHDEIVAYNKKEAQRDVERKRKEIKQAYGVDEDNVQQQKAQSAQNVQTMQNDNQDPKSDINHHHHDKEIDALFFLPNSHLAQMTKFISLHAPPSIFGFPRNLNIVEKFKIDPDFNLDGVELTLSESDQSLLGLDLTDPFPTTPQPHPWSLNSPNLLPTSVMPMQVLGGVGGTVTGDIAKHFGVSSSTSFAPTTNTPSPYQPAPFSITPTTNPITNPFPASNPSTNNHNQDQNQRLNKVREIYDWTLFAKGLETDVSSALTRINPYVARLYRAVYSPIFEFRGSDVSSYGNRSVEARKDDGEEELWRQESQKKQSEKDQKHAKSTSPQSQQKMYVTTHLFNRRSDAEIDAFLSLDGEVSGLLPPATVLASAPVVVQVSCGDYEIHKAANSNTNTQPPTTTATTILPTTPLPTPPTPSQYRFRSTPTQPKPFIVDIELATESSGSTDHQRQRAQQRINNIVQLYVDKSTQPQSQPVFAHLTPQQCVQKMRDADRKLSWVSRWFNTVKRDDNDVNSDEHSV